jgi:hypothetical protein
MPMNGIRKLSSPSAGPVEIPGQVLGAGTYVFKLADSRSDGNIVQVFSKNENHQISSHLWLPHVMVRLSANWRIRNDLEANKMNEYCDVSQRPIVRLIDELLKLARMSSQPRSQRSWAPLHQRGEGAAISVNIGGGFCGLDRRLLLPTCVSR